MRNVRCEPANYVNWANCSLRYWLNDSFYYTAFDQSQRAYILASACPMDENPDYYVHDPGGDTYDYVFLLSWLEIDRYFYGKDNTCSPTSYAIAQGTWVNENNKCWWWTRTLGFNQDDTQCVYSHGGIDLNGSGVWDTGGGVRPAVWVDLNAFA